MGQIFGAGQVTGGGQVWQVTGGGQVEGGGQISQIVGGGQVGGRYSSLRKKNKENFVRKVAPSRIFFC